MKLDGVRDDSPAAKAGLKAGDKVVKLAGREVKNIYDYTYALGEMKAGQEYEVEIVRGSERLTLKITPAPLTVTPANAWRFYGASNPPLTGTIAGLKNGDAISATYATAATAASATAVTMNLFMTPSPVSGETNPRLAG